MTSPLSVDVGGVRLRNPVLVASGTFGAGLEAVEQGVDLAAIGGVVTKSVTTQPRAGNPPPRICETASGMLNSIGIMNPGVDGFLAEIMPRFAALPCARVVNVAGESAEDFEILVGRFDAVDGCDAIELNVSCPNVSGGLDFGIDVHLLESLVRGCRARTRKPLWVKLTPNVTDVVPLARAAVAGGADALALTNTFLGMAVDWRRRLPRLGSKTGAGGLSGPAIKPLALHAVFKVARAVDVPIVGIGGIRDADDAMEFIVAGATAVQVGTSNFTDPAAAVDVADQLAAFVREGLFTDLASVRKTLVVPRPHA